MLDIRSKMKAKNCPSSVGLNTLLKIIQRSPLSFSLHPLQNYKLNYEETNNDFTL